MLTIKPLCKGCAEHDAVLRIYKAAFPKRERDPFHKLLGPKKEGHDFIAFYDGPLFVGFAYLLTYLDITHILYFAVDGNLRGHGYGTQALDALREWKKGNRFLADLEQEGPHIHNYLQREQRMHFYRHDGFEKTDIRYRWKHEDYEIWVCGGTLSADEFDAFWQHFRYDDEMGDYLYQTFKKHDEPDVK